MQLQTSPAEGQKRLMDTKLFWNIKREKKMARVCKDQCMTVVSGVDKSAPPAPYWFILVLILVKF